MFNNLALRGLLSLFGAFLISLAVGINYLWGIITIYGTSYFRIMMWDATLTQDKTDIVFPLMLLGQVHLPSILGYFNTFCFQICQKSITRIDLLFRRNRHVFAYVLCLLQLKFFQFCHYLWPREWNRPWNHLYSSYWSLLSILS